MPKSNEHYVQARSLRDTILAAPAVWLPRREALLMWLNAFLVRAEAPRFALEGTEEADLVALADYLKTQKVPAV